MNKRYKEIIWNPIAFFTSMMMSFIMSAIAVIPQGMPIEQVILSWPRTWLIAYCLVNFFVNKISFRLARKIFNYPPAPE